MGNEESQDVASDDPEDALPEDFTIDAFKAIRTNNTIENAIQCLDRIAKDLSKIDLDNPPNLKFDRACFICCNTYVTKRYQLGVGPFNDSYRVAVNHRKMGFVVYYLHNPPHLLFLKALKLVLERTTKDLTIFYTGHGASVKDESGDEDDGLDECMVFDDGIVIDDTLAEYLSKYHNKKSRTVLLADCCHSGSIWDLQSGPLHNLKLPKHILSISAAADDQTAKQKKVDSMNQGLFSHYFWRYHKRFPYITSIEMEKRINPYLQQYKQKYVATATSPEMLTDPIFPPKK